MWTRLIMNFYLGVFFLCGVQSALYAQDENLPAQVREKIEQLAAYKDANGWKTLYYDVLPQVIRLNRYKKVVEIGVALGGHAEFLLKNTGIEQYVGIDPYIPYDPADGFQQEISRFSASPIEKNFDYLCEWVSNVRLAPYQQRCQLIRKASVIAASDFEDESLECIFIDGDHRYEAVLEDLKAWYPKLKPGHLILGDDYWMASVANAVDRFFADEGKKVCFMTSSADYKIWAVRK